MYLCCFGHGLAEHLDLEVSEGRVKSDGLFASEMGKLSGAEKKRGSKITMVFRVSASDGGGGRGRVINRFVGSEPPTLTYRQLLIPPPALPLSNPLRPLRHVARKPTTALNPRRRPLLPLPQAPSVRVRL
jgi:hypothetical protein